MIGGRKTNGDMLRFVRVFGVRGVENGDFTTGARSNAFGNGIKTVDIHRRGGWKIKRI